jgi:hypothetical protein
MALDPYQLDLLVRTMYGEAASEPADGQAAVASVILNRLKQGDRYGGDTIEEIVKAPKQFEPWGNANTRSRMMSLAPTSPRYQTLSGIAQRVASGEIPDPTGGATHFANEAIVRQRRGGTVPSWMAKMPVAGKIGNHTFYGGTGAAAPPQSGLPPPASPNLTPASPGQPPPPPQWAQQFPSPPTPPQMASAPGQSLSPGITPPIAPPIPAPRPDIGASDPLGGIASAFSSLGAMGEGSAPAPAAPPPPPMARAPTQDTLAPFLAQYMATVLGRRY